MTETISHWIDGKRQDGYSGRAGPALDPATGKERERVAFASSEEVDKTVVAAAGERSLDGSLIAEARVIQSREFAIRPKEPFDDGPLEEIECAGALERPAADAEHRKARGVINRTIGDSLALHPLFCPPFCPP